MKRLTYLLATMLIGGMIFTSCKKDEKKVDPTPAPTTAKIVYKIDNTMTVMGVQMTASDCFSYNIIYKGADGNNVNVNNVKLPWTSPEITVNLPFDARFEGTATYNENELPDVLNYGHRYSISASGVELTRDGDISDYTKASFIQFVTENPEKLHFTCSFNVH